MGWASSRTQPSSRGASARKASSMLTNSAPWKGSANRTRPEAGLELMLYSRTTAPSAVLGPLEGGDDEGRALEGQEGPFRRQGAGAVLHPARPHRHGEPVRLRPGLLPVALMGDERVVERVPAEHLGARRGDKRARQMLGRDVRSKRAR